jgi:hypothetical protein
VKIHHIRRFLQKRRGTLFFSQAERTLLAVLQLTEYKTLSEAVINADYTKGAQCERMRLYRAIEEAWGKAA